MKKLLGRITLGFTVMVAVAVMAAALVPTPRALAQGPTLTVSGSIYGFFDPTFEGRGAWVGWALISFGDGPPVAAKFADRNTSLGFKPNGWMYGTETISLLFLDGSGTLDILGSFVAIPGSTPNIGTLVEVGSFAHGTKKYSGVTGHVTITGPAILPDPNTTPGTPPWISEIHGVIVGLQ